MGRGVGWKWGWLCCCDESSLCARGAGKRLFCTGNDGGSNVTIKFLLLLLVQTTWLHKCKLNNSVYVSVWVTFETNTQTNKSDATRVWGKETEREKYYAGATRARLEKKGKIYEKLLLHKII